MPEILVLAAYAACLVLLFLYGLIQLDLWRRHRRHAGTVRTPEAMSPLPRVTVQLPIYNERHVARRVIDHAARLDWPGARLQIQVLDDSDDETVEICALAAAEWRARGVAIEHVRRARREGFKAGALRDGLDGATGEFIALFDADFCPAPDFLRLTIPHFVDPRIAAVQLRWGFLNENYSALTRVQAFFLRMHFNLEQAARSADRLFCNFNGTAGVWRRAAIVDAGGWRADTLTEDIDLSYRAQLKGWLIQYLEQAACPSELPVEIGGLRSQQFRWMKGGAQNARIHLGPILRSDLPAAVKLHASAHLLAGSVYALILLTVLLSVPLAALKNSSIEADYVQYGAPFFLSTALLGVVLFRAQGARTAGWRGWLWFLTWICAFMVFTLGLCVHNGVAALRGLAGEPGEFVRTPKYGALSSGEWRRSSYARQRPSGLAIGLEASALLLLLLGLAIGWIRDEYALYPIELLAAGGIGWQLAAMGGQSLRMRRAGSAPMSSRLERNEEDAPDRACEAEADACAGLRR